MTPIWARQKIDINRNLKIANLDLEHLPSWVDVSKLVEIPSEVFELTWLQNINLRNNEITLVPNAISRFINIEVFNLSHNQVTTLPESIVKLENLQELDLSSNRLKFLPKTFHRLKNLTRLNLSENKLAEIPQVIRRLKSLKILNLSGNLLTTVPAWLIDMPKLETLFLYGNEISMPPPEVLYLKEWRSVDLETLRAYYRQLAESGTKYLYEAKLLILGEPGAGKTSLTRKLLLPTAPLPGKDESTEGIDVHTWMIPLSVTNTRESVSEIEILPQNNDQQITRSDHHFRINIWDFGGQEIYHATHQFFLSRRSLYIIVADAREQKTDFFHWLDLIEHLSARSPVFIFNNEIQNRHWAINEQQLVANFPKTFQKPFAFNLRDNIVELNLFRQKILEQIIHLPHVGDVLPRTWIDVRYDLENDSRLTITIQEFLKLCHANGFTNREDAFQLSGYLHDLGVILHFKDDPLLQKVVILKPEWGTDAVYRILDNERIITKMGRFNRSDLHKIWHEDEYIFLHNELIALMINFQLCYRIPNQEDHYIAPQLLGEQPPDYRWNNENNLRLRYKYEAFMPKGLLTRFIVAMHAHIVKQRLVWRTGVVLFRDGTVAEIVEFYHRREIHIRVAGKNKRDLLTIISYELDKLHRPFHRLKFDKLIPCNCSTCYTSGEPYFYRMDILKTRLEHGKTVIECDKPPFETMPILPLLDDVGAAVQPADLPDLLRGLNRNFNDDDFRTVCFELGITYDNLSGDGLEGKQRELLLLMERNGRLLGLINLLRKKRPNWDW